MRCNVCGFKNRLVFGLIHNILQSESYAFTFPLERRSGFERKKTNKKCPSEIDDLDNLYKEDDRNDIYYIALQLLMENFAQFLSANDGIGTIYLETTDAVNNKRLQNLFHLLKATGTLFVKKEALQERLSTINFAIKSENIIGLQLADFIPNSLARKALSKKQKPYSILDGIDSKLYDGKVGMKDRLDLKS